jgi:hypothetical protein
MCGTLNSEENEIPTNYYKKRIYFADDAATCGTVLPQDAIVTKTYSVDDEDFTCGAEHDYNYVFVNEGNYYKTYTETLSGFQLTEDGGETSINPIGEIKDVVTVGSDDNGCRKLTYSYEGSLSFTYDDEQCYSLDGGASIKEDYWAEGTLGRSGVNGRFDEQTLYGQVTFYDDGGCSLGALPMNVYEAGTISATWNTRSDRVYSNPVTPELGYFDPDTEDAALARAREAFIAQLDENEDPPSEDEEVGYEEGGCTSTYEIRTDTRGFIRRTLTYSLLGFRMVRGCKYKGCVEIMRRKAYSGTIPNDPETGEEEVLEWETVEPDIIEPFVATKTREIIVADVKLPIVKGYTYMVGRATIWPVYVECDCPFISEIEEPQEGSEAP